MEKNDHHRRTAEAVLDCHKAQKVSYRSIDPDP